MNRTRTNRRGLELTQVSFEVQLSFARAAQAILRKSHQSVGDYCREALKALVESNDIRKPEASNGK